MKKWEKWEIVCGKKYIKHFYTTNLFNAVQYDTIWYQSVRFLVKSRFHGKSGKRNTCRFLHHGTGIREIIRTFRFLPLLAAEKSTKEHFIGRGRRSNAKVQSRNKLIQFLFTFPWISFECTAKPSSLCKIIHWQCGPRTSRFPLFW